MFKVLLNLQDISSSNEILYIAYVLLSTVCQYIGLCECRSNLYKRIGVGGLARNLSCSSDGEHKGRHCGAAQVEKPALQR